MIDLNLFLKKINDKIMVNYSYKYVFLQLQCCGIEGPKDWDRNNYFNCFEDWKKRWGKCVLLYGYYFELIWKINKKLHFHTELNAQYHKKS